MGRFDHATTYLFVPGDRPERFVKATRSGASVVIIDLEDAVAPANKRSARTAILADWTSLTTVADTEAVVLCVRINALREESSREDLALCKLIRPALIMVPKVESAEEVRTIVAEVPDSEILALIETPLGVLESQSIAAAPSISRLVLGSVDLMLALGVSDDRAPLDLTRSMLVLASAAAKIAAPVDGVCTSVEDLERVSEDTHRAHSLGLTAKLCIHPKQVSAVAQAFDIVEKDVAWAKRVVASFAASQGAATTVDGKMVDVPVYLRAQRMLAHHAHRESQ